MGEIVNLNAEQLAQNLQNEGHVHSQLFKELNEDLLLVENKLLA